MSAKADILQWRLAWELVEQPYDLLVVGGRGRVPDDSILIKPDWSLPPNAEMPIACTTVMNLVSGRAWGPQHSGLLFRGWRENLCRVCPYLFMMVWSGSKARPSSCWPTMFSQNSHNKVQPFCSIMLPLLSMVPFGRLQWDSIPSPGTSIPSPVYSAALAC